MPHVRSVAMGVWVTRGSRHEDLADHGLTHFTEHMVFKGTDTRSAEDIAAAIDGIGGHLDAFTSRETTAFTAKVLDERLPVALDILSDMSLRPAFREEDIEKEKGVVLEELKMDEDNPDYLIHDLFTSNFWKKHALGRSIIGTKDSIQAFSQDQLRDFFTRTFHPANLLITAAGQLEHEKFVDEVAARFGALEARTPEPDAEPPKPLTQIVLRKKRSLEQVHLCLGVPIHAMTDPRRFIGYILSTILGGGFSSRLFLKIRERAGLAYSVYSDPQSLLRHRCAHRRRRHVARSPRKGHRVYARGVSQPQRQSCRRRRAAPREGSPQGQHHAEPGIDLQPHVEPRAPASLLRPHLLDG
ncbi:MAG: pitrilysin family protein [Bryobacterales bacterium]